MHVTPSILAIRSIGAEYANRLFLFVAILFSLSAAILFGLSIWLTSLSDWWWLLVALLIVAFSIGLGVLVVFKLVIRTVRPYQTKQQRAKAKNLVNKLESLSETAQTPKLILLFRIIRDIAAPRSSGFIGSISNDTTSLKHDFIELTNIFK